MLYVPSFNKIVILCLCFYIVFIHSMIFEFYMVFMFLFNITGQMANNEEKSHPASNNDGNESIYDVEMILDEE